MQVNLEPSLGSTLATSSLRGVFSAQANSIALYPTPNQPSNPPTDSAAKYIYLAQYETSQLERREFKVASYTIWASLQQIVNQEGGAAGGFDSRGLNGGPSVEVQQYINRIAKLYQSTILNQIAAVQEDSSLDDDAKLDELQHLASLHAVLSLTEILYLPADGRGDGVVGEEVLDWLNTIDRAPSSEEGEELADLSRPWEHPNWWDYLNKALSRGLLLSVTALLALVKTHPSATLQRLATLAIDQLESFPRSTKFAAESRFLSTLSSWRVKAKAASRQADDLCAQLEGELGPDEAEDWTIGFKSLFELMEGKESRVLEVTEDWREALGAWGVWVNPGGRREDLPETLALITKHHPVDTTLPADTIQSSLVLGEVTRALQQANSLSTELVAHLANLLDKIEVVEAPEPGTEQLTLRDHFLLSYADGLLADPSLWRIAVDYLATCGEVGRARMRQIVRRVDLEEPAGAEDGEEQGMEVEGGAAAGEEVKGGRVVDDVIAVCAKHGLGDEVVAVCKAWSETLIGQQRYGEAVAYCVKAGDAKRIARIAERVLDEYVTNGQDAFIRHVDSIPTSLLRPGATALRPELFGERGPPSPTHTARIDGDDEDELLARTGLTPYSARLSFLARYRDFFAFYARGERRQAASLLVLLMSSNVAPRSFYGVMLLDVVPLLESEEILVTLEETYDLLRCLEEITAPIEASGGKDVYGHLSSLAKIVGATGSKEECTRKALKQLEVVRAALARHLGRCCCL